MTDHQRIMLRALLRGPCSTYDLAEFIGEPTRAARAELGALRADGFVQRVWSAGRRQWTLTPQARMAAGELLEALRAADRLEVA